MTIEGDGDKEYPDEDEVTSNRLVQERENVSQDCEFKVETVNGDVRGGCVGTLQAKCGKDFFMLPPLRCFWG
ncbi:hypothetical protein P3S68_028669 [Capsicum galapagoense]